MADQNSNCIVSAIFLTFSGNCRDALTFYHLVFGGSLTFQDFDKPLPGFAQTPVVSGQLISEQIVIYGSDLLPDEGRRVGNHIAVLLHCRDAQKRRQIAAKLDPSLKADLEHDRLVEVVDGYGVKWALMKV